MVKKSKTSKRKSHFSAYSFVVKMRKNKTPFFISVIAVLLILLLAYFLYNHFLKPNNYKIENKYYGFQLQAPNGWIAKEDTFYSEDNIAKILATNQNNQQSNLVGYEVGEFRFESQKYPDNFIDSQTLPTNFSSGAILEVTVFYIPNLVKIVGENEIKGSSDSTLFGKVNSISLAHNNFQYKIDEYSYVSPSDTKNDNKIRDDYSKVFDKIISSFKFTK